MLTVLMHNICKDLRSVQMKSTIVAAGGCLSSRSLVITSIQDGGHSELTPQSIIRRTTER
jgi:hypothetical protein